MRFEYDPKKSASNKDKHGIDFEDAQALWDDDDRLEVMARFDGEVRYLLIGQLEQRMWTAVFTVRGEAIRLISVRRSRDDEIRHYQDDHGGGV